MRRCCIPCTHLVEGVGGVAVCEVGHRLTSKRSGCPDAAPSGLPVTRLYCVGCRRIKPLSAFNIDRRSASGRCCYCRDCSKAAMAEWRGRVQERIDLPKVSAARPYLPDDVDSFKEAFWDISRFVV